MYFKESKRLNKQYLQFFQWPLNVSVECNDNMQTKYRQKGRSSLKFSVDFVQGLLVKYSQKYKVM